MCTRCKCRDMFGCRDGRQRPVAAATHNQEDLHILTDLSHEQHSTRFYGNRAARCRRLEICATAAECWSVGPQLRVDNQSYRGLRLDNCPILHISTMRHLTGMLMFIVILPPSQ